MLGEPALAHAGEQSALEPLSDSLEGGGHGDGVYGRFDGPVALSLGAGLEAVPTPGVVRPTALVGARFYQSVGLALSLAQSVTSTDPLERSLAASFLVEPVFLLRWSGDHEWGRAFWDLALDSISLSAGAFCAQPRAGNFCDGTGFRLGLGAGVPLLAKAGGPWLRLGGRLDTGLGTDLVGAFWANLEWQWFLLGRSSD
jgi:hypothetical protein